MKASNTLLSAALAATLLTGCTNDEGQAPVPNLAGTPIRIHTNLLASTLTRAGYESDESLQGSSFGLFLTTPADATNDPRYNARNMKFSYTDPGWTAQLAEGEAQLLWKNSNTTVNFRAYMPYQPDAVDADSYTYTFNLPPEQNTEEAFLAADLLYAEGTATATAGAAIGIQFQHRLSLLTIHLLRGTELEGREITFDAVKLSGCCVMQTDIDLQPADPAGAGTGSGDADAGESGSGEPAATTGSGTVTLLRTPEADGTEDFQCILIPQSQPLTVTIEATETLADGSESKKLYRYVSGRQMLESSTKYELTLKVAHDKVTSGTVSVTEWTPGDLGLEGEDLTAEALFVTDPAQHCIMTYSAGVLTQDAVIAAIGSGADGTNCALEVSGPLNSNDIKAINSGMAQSTSMRISLDLSGVTGLTEIPDYAFNLTNSTSPLSSIILPEGITSIGRAAFLDCANLQSITLPTSVTSIGAYAFSKCYYLKSIDLPASVTSIGDSAFSNSGITTIDLSNVKTIEGNVFANCPLTSVIFPDINNGIPNSCFAGCSVLQSIDLSACSSVPTIGTGAFQNIRTGNVTVYVKDEDMKQNFQNTDWKDFNIQVKGGTTGGEDGDNPIG